MTKPKAKSLLKKPGRHSKAKSINLEHLKFLVDKGCTDDEICQFFKMSRTALWRYEQANPEFRNTIKDWKKAADERVERSLYERAVGYSHPSEEIFCAFGKTTRVPIIKHYAPSEVACFMWLKNRKPLQWRDKVNDQADDELKETELTFTGVPMKGGKLPDSMTRFLN